MQSMNTAAFLAAFSFLVVFGTLTGSLRWNALCPVVLIFTVVCYIAVEAYIRLLNESSMLENSDAIHSADSLIARFALPFDPSSKNLECLQRFRAIQNNTECIFAKKAKLWAQGNWEGHLSLEDNLRRHALPGLLRFTCKILSDAKCGLDGFVVEARGREYWESIDTFGATVFRILLTIAENSPDGRNCMRRIHRTRRSGPPYDVSEMGWRFVFNGVVFFVTTFAPCYGSDHSRYCFTERESCFVLLQPDSSFVMHDIGADTPRSATNWENPVSMRDKIRCLFRKHGREYEIPESTRYAMADHVVKPMRRGGDVVRWWEQPDY
eukprot:Rmarinus@m.16514